jgi:Domain of unknown function (DUF4185)
MSALRRIASVSAASAAAVGLIVPIGVAPPAAAAPCAQTVPAATPNILAPTTPVPRPVEHLPIGRKPIDADARAPLPRLGPLPGDPDSPNSAPLQDQGAVIPWPNPPGMGNQPVPNAIQQSPNAAPAPAAAVTAPTTSIAGWVDGPASPNNTFQRFGISGADLGIVWDNGDPSNDQALIAFGDTFGDCGVAGQQWRRNTMFRSPDRTLGDGIAVPDGVVGHQYSYLQKYVVLYCSGSNNVVIRTAPAPQGPWSAPQVLVKSAQIPGGLYAPFIHPWSSGKDLYFNLSLWSAYSVMLMHTVLP